MSAHGTVLTLGHGTTLFVDEPFPEVVELLRPPADSFIRLTASAGGSCYVRVGAIAALWEAEAT